MALTDSVAARIRAELESQDISYRELGRRLGKSIAYVSRRLSDEPDVDLRLDEIESIAAALEVPATRFLPAGDQTAAAS